MLYTKVLFVLELLILPLVVIGNDLDDRSTEMSNKLSTDNFLYTYYGYLDISFGLSTDMLPSTLSIKQYQEDVLSKFTRIEFQHKIDRLEINFQDITADESANEIIHLNMPFTTNDKTELQFIQFIFQDEQATMHIKQQSTLIGEQSVSYNIPLLLEQYQQIQIVSSFSSLLLITTQDSNVTGCSAGYYWQSGGECMACPAGTYSSEDNSTSCTICPPGSYSNSTSTSCYLCSSGSYAEDFGSTTCSLCGNGTFSEVGASNCTSCPPGSYSSEEGSSYCIPCGAGSYAADGASSCSLCPPGSYSQSNSSSCQLCGRGTYAPIPGLSYCPSCPPGTIASLSGSLSCIPCSDGTVSSGNGTLCLPCANGQVANSEHSECVDDDSSDEGNSGILLALGASVIAGSVLIGLAVVVYKKRLSPKQKPLMNYQNNPEGRPLMDMEHNQDFDEEGAFPDRNQLPAENPMEFLFMKRKSEISRDSIEDAIQEDLCKNELANLIRQMEEKNKDLLEASASVVDEFLDPITKQIMTDPVVAADGCTYEKGAMEIWMKYHRKSPVTKRTLDNKVLVPNSRIKHQIHLFRLQVAQSHQAM